MKRTFYAAIFFGMILLSGNAFGTTFVDQTDNIVGSHFEMQSNNSSKQFFDYDSVNEVYNWQDTIGIGFDTTQVEINESASGLTISLFTEFDGFASIGTAEVELADFFITNNSGSVYGVDLSWGVIRTDSSGNDVYGVFSGGIYSLGTAEYYITSRDVFSTTLNTEFAGFYDIDGDKVNNGTWKKINVDFEQSQAAKLDGIDVTTTTTTGSSYIYSFGIDSTIVDSMDVSNGYSFLFGTAECGNDVIHGAVPEPSTLLLLGFGLLGIGALGRRKVRI